MKHRPNNAICEPAHPWIADALCGIGANFADAAQSEIENLTDWRVELAAAVLFAFACMLFSFVAPYLPALGRIVSP